MFHEENKIVTNLQMTTRGWERNHSIHILPLPTPVQIYWQNTFIWKVCILPFSNIKRGNEGAYTYYMGIMVKWFHGFGIFQYNLSMIIAVLELSTTHLLHSTDWPLWQEIPTIGGTRFDVIIFKNHILTKPLQLV